MKSFICAGLIGFAWGIISTKIGIPILSVDWFVVLISISIVNQLIWYQIEK